MKPIKIEICLGTTCFVMGGETLQNMGDMLKKKYGAKIEVEAVRCLEVCSSDNFSKAPYARVDGEVIGEASLEKVQAVIEKKLNHE
ncbi:MAG: NAD(P)H-dependent oxidoreductase subunit E [Alphaproteobacteria bacterium]|nr:NAD(P)H-dependent oxidoreductase subunit E [Alphaproteobacteria bacterium]